MIFYSTRWGPWAGSDSATLIAPTYPLVLAGLTELGIPTLSAARWLNIILSGGFIFLIGFTASILSGSAWIALPVSLMLLVFPVIVDMYSGIMTEPVFLTAAMGGLLSIVLYLESHRRWYLIGAAILCGIAAVTRFIGIALLPVGMIALLVFGLAPWKRKVGEALLYVGIFLIVLLPWNIWYLFHQDTSALLERPRWTSAWDYLQPVRAGLVNVLWGWLPFQDALPVQRYIWKAAILALIAALFFFLLIWGSFRLYRHSLSQLLADRDFRLMGVMTLYLFAYVTVFIFIYLFRNPPQDIDERTLLPLYPPGILTLFGVLSLLYRSFADRISRHLILVGGWMICLCFCLSFAPRSLALLNRYHQSGGGYTGEAWRSSPTIRAVQNLASTMVIISNDTGAILFFTGKLGLEVKELSLAEPLPEFTRFGDDPSDEIQAQFREQGAALVLFQPAFYWKMHDLYRDQTDERIAEFTRGLILYGKYADGEIYFYPVRNKQPDRSRLNDVCRASTDQPQSQVPASRSSAR